MLHAVVSPPPVLVPTSCARYTIRMMAAQLRAPLTQRRCRHHHRRSRCVCAAAAAVSHRGGNSCHRRRQHRCRRRRRALTKLQHTATAAPLSGCHCWARRSRSERGAAHSERSAHAAAGHSEARVLAGHELAAARVGVEVVLEHVVPERYGLRGTENATRRWVQQRASAGRVQVKLVKLELGAGAGAVQAGALTSERVRYFGTDARCLRLRCTRASRRCNCDVEPGGCANTPWAR
jgi:hypothetical protein